MQIDASPGEHISRVAQRAVNAVAAGAPRVVFDFNGIMLTVERGHTADDVCAEYDRRSDEQARAYWTPERLAAKEAEERTARAAMLAHIEALGATDLTDRTAAMRWLCGLERLAFVYAPYDAAAVVSRFVAAGYKSNALCRRSDHRRPESVKAWERRVGRNGRIKWLIGQALDGIERRGAPNGIIHRFAADFGIKP